MVTERRRFARKEEIVLVDFTVGERFFYDYAKNLGEGGAFVQSEHALEVGQEVRARYTVSKVDHVFEAQAKVAWIRTDKTAPGFGLSFIRMDDADRDRLRAHLDQKNA